MARTRICWTDEEWDKLAGIIFPIYMREPATPFSDLIDRAMGQFPVERRRKVAGFALMQPLVSRMIALGQKMKADAEEVQSLRDKASHEPQPHELYVKYREQFLPFVSVSDILHSVSLERVLAEIPDEELFMLVARRMAAISQIARLASLTLETQQRQPQAQTPLMASAKRKPLVVVAGPKGDQIQIMEHELKELVDLRVIDKDKNQGIPVSGACYVVWVRFVGHATQLQMEAVAKAHAAPFRLFNGGVKELIANIRAEFSR